MQKAVTLAVTIVQCLTVTESITRMRNYITVGKGHSQTSRS